MADTSGTTGLPNAGAVSDEGIARNARETLAPKIEVMRLGDYVRNVGYRTGSITCEYETK